LEVVQLEFAQIDPELEARAAALIDAAIRHNCSIVTAESCTGGLLAALLSEAPGAGEALAGGYVTYTKPQKSVALGVPAALLERESAVSERVARAMAEGALRRSQANLAVAITGVAGPSCDEDGNPVGLVHLAVAANGQPTRHREHRFGDIGPGAVKRAALMAAFDLLDECLALADPSRRAAE
jgi:nicotinamide-nucleotide amidase